MMTDDLVYAAVARCLCGAGMAFYRPHFPNTYWDCSEILMRRANPNILHMERHHLDAIMEENHPRAYGHTTRPTTAPAQERPPMKLVASESMADRIRTLEETLHFCSEFIIASAEFTTKVVQKCGETIMDDAREFSKKTQALVDQVEALRGK